MNSFIIILIVILVLIYIEKKVFYNETFENANIDTNANSIANSIANPEKLKLYIFVSKHCPHCHTYLDNQHENVSALAKSKGVQIEKVESDDSAKSNDLFGKFEVQFIPTAIIVKGDKVFKNLGSNITPQSVKTALEN